MLDCIFLHALPTLPFEDRLFLHLPGDLSRRKLLLHDWVTIKEPRLIYHNGILGIYSN